MYIYIFLRDTFYVNALTNEERDYFLYWLKSSFDLKHDSHPLFENQIVHYLFSKKIILACDPSKLDAGLYEAFEKFFKFLSLVDKV